MDEVQVNVQDGRAARLIDDNVVFPDFVDDGFGVGSASFLLL
ncbi:MAG: hypothetical protein M5U34_30480 [Chloroflexi bacterium]|nr:hypothetical protein [Chloroflexota bacterium]